MSKPACVEKLTHELGKLPGIGPKSAERLANHLLQASVDQALALAQAIEEVKRTIRPCARCFNFAEEMLCTICADAARDAAQVCVVEQPRDLAALEKTRVYRGVYHVLLGRIAPLEGMLPDRLTIGALVDRVRSGTVREVILATNPTLEGEGTALHIASLLSDYPVRVTRPARGLAAGVALEFANHQMLEDALAGRRDF